MTRRRVRRCTAGLFNRAHAQKSPQQRPSARTAATALIYWRLRRGSTSAAGLRSRFRRRSWIDSARERGSTAGRLPGASGSLRVIASYVGGPAAPRRAPHRADWIHAATRLVPGGGTGRRRRRRLPRPPRPRAGQPGLAAVARAQCPRRARFVGPAVTGQAHPCVPAARRAHPHGEGRRHRARCRDPVPRAGGRAHLPRACVRRVLLAAHDAAGGADRAPACVAGQRASSPSSEASGAMFWRAASAGPIASSSSHSGCPSTRLVGATARRGELRAELGLGPATPLVGIVARPRR